MNSAKGKTIYILSAIFVVTIIMVTMVTPALAQQGPEIRVTHSETRADQPDVAVDSKGNVHIAYCNNYTTDTYQIWYTMLDNNGNTLIDDTRITDTNPHSKRPAIVVDSEDKVHIVWHLGSQAAHGTSEDLFYTKLDPSLDDQNGGPADPDTITVVADKPLMDWGDDYATDPRMAIDSNDDIHIVWDNLWGYADKISYMKIDNFGNQLIAPIVIRSAPFSLLAPAPDVAVDSNNNVHITWNDLRYTGSYEIYYMMLDGSDGSTSINATPITPDDSWPSWWQSIVVDFEDKVHIIWEDWIYLLLIIGYTKLDPSLDDQNGDAADPSLITLDAKTLTLGGNFPTSASACGRYIHITWYEDWEGGGGPGYLHYMVLDTYGDIVVADTPLITGKTASTLTLWTLAYLDVDCNGKAHITWCDDRDSPGNYTEVYYTSYQGPIVDCCRKAPSPPPGVPALSQWGAIGMIIALAGCIVWTLRRRIVSLN